jgi:hypothetical protein
MVYFMYLIKYFKLNHVFYVAISLFLISCGSEKDHKSGFQLSAMPEKLEDNSVVIYRGEESRNPHQSCTLTIKNDQNMKTLEMVLETGYYKFPVTTLPDGEYPEETWVRTNFRHQPSVRHPGYTRIGYMYATASFWRLIQLSLPQIILELLSSGEVFIAQKDDYSNVIAERAFVYIGGIRAGVETISCENMHRE